METKEAKEKMSNRLEFEVLKMRKYCQQRQITNAEIAKNCGLPASQVWRFLNRTSPDMSMLRFVMIAEGIGFKLSFNLN